MSDPASPLPDIAYTSVTLPSHGMWYGEQMPGGVVEVRKSTVREDLILDSDNLPVMDRINRLVRACSRFPDKTFNYADLLITDRMALALAVRGFTYGSKYTFSSLCRACRAENVETVDFASAEMSERTPDVICEENGSEFSLAEPFTFALPDAKVTVAFRHLRVSDDEAIEKRLKGDSLLKAQRINMPGVDLSPLVQLSQRLVSVNGQADVPNSKRDAFFMGLSSSDSRAIRKFLSQYDTGIRMVVTRSCTACGTEQKVPVPLTLQTFRSESDSE